jgi:aspartate 4-decarboxylase
MAWARRQFGAEFAQWLAASFEPIEPVFRLAANHSVVLLNGGGFDDSAWSVRVSLANLPADAYVLIGASLRAVFDEYLAEWQEVR